MTNMNKAYFLGTIGRTPELRTSVGGEALALVSIGTPRVERIDGEVVTNMDWHRLTAKGDLAAVVAGFGKGDKVAVECVCIPRRWTDKDGNAHHDVAMKITSVLWRTAASPAAVAAVAE